MREKVQINRYRVAMIVSFVLLFNIICPWFNSPVIAYTGGTLDLSNYLTSVVIKDTNPTYDAGAVLSAYLNYNVPQQSDSNFNASNSVLVYDFNSVVAIEQGSTDGTSALDISKFSSSSLSGPIKIAGSTLPYGSYTYTLVNDPSSPDYGKVFLDFSAAFDGDNMIDSAIYGSPADFEFSCNLDASAFKDDSANYTLRFVNDVSFPNPTITVNDKPTHDYGLLSSKTAGEVDLANGTVAYTITVKNTGSETCDSFIIKDTVSGHLNSIIPESVQIINGDGVTYAAPVNSWDTTSSFTFPSGIDAGETVTITYNVSLKDSVYSDNVSTYGFNNTITAVSTNPSDTRPILLTDTATSLSSSPNITFNLLNKDGSYDSANNLISWTIRVNDGDTRLNLDGYTLHDSFDSIPQDLVGSITVTDVTTGQISTLSSLSDLSSYSFGNTTDTFEFTYQTEPTADYSSSTTSVSTTNTASITNPSGATIATKEKSVTIHTVAAPTSYVPVANKTFEESSFSADGNTLYMSWNVSVELPDEISSAVSITDDLKWTQQHIFDTSKNPVVYYLDADNQPVYIPTTAYTVTMEGNNTPMGMPRQTIAINDVALLESLAGKTLYASFYTMIALAANQFGTSVAATNYAKAFVNNAYSNEVSDNENISIPARENYMNKFAGTFDPATGLIPYTLKINYYEGWSGDLPVTTNIWSSIVIDDDLGGLSFYGYNRDASHQGGVLVEVGYGSFYYINASDIQNTSTGIRIDVSKAYSLDDGSSINLVSVGTNRIILYYSTKVETADYPISNTAVTVVNNATFTGIVNGTTNPVSSNSSASTPVDADVISKVLNTTQEDLNSSLENDVLSYTIRVNPYGVTLASSSNTTGTFLVIDSLPTCLDYVIGSLIVTNTSTNEVLSPDTLFDEVVDGSHYEFLLVERTDGAYDLKIWVPDNTPLSITYKTRINVASGNNNISIVNSVLVPDPYVQESSSESSSENRHIAVSNANVYDNNRVFYVDKTGSTDADSFLAGATFEAVEYTLAGVATGNVFRMTTNATGSVSSGEFSVFSGVSTAKISFNYVYEIREIEAPIGYQLDTTVRRVAILKQTAESAVTMQNVSILPAGAHLSFINTATVLNPVSNSVVINKSFENHPEITAGVTFTIHQNTIDGSILGVMTRNGETQEYSYDSTLYPGTYYIVETDTPDDFSGCNPIKLVVSESGEITVTLVDGVTVMATSTDTDVVLSVVNADNSAPVPTATDTPVPTATDTPVPTATDTPVPTATDTPVPTATDTPVPTATDTPVPTATDTPVPTAIDTPVPTATDTPVPTATDTPAPTPTPTPADNTLTINKVFGNGDDVTAEVVFTIYDASNSSVGVFVKDGEHQIYRYNETLIPGVYTIVETNTPSGYIGIDPIEVTVDELGVIQVALTETVTVSAISTQSDVVVNVTNKAIVPTATNTPVPTATNTPVPTATNTPVPTATNTPVPTATNTPVPTATNTPVPTNTVAPTATNTPVATPTVATPTPVVINNSMTINKIFYGDDSVTDLVSFIVYDSTGTEVGAFYRITGTNTYHFNETLAEGTYTIEESNTPSGYVACEPIEVTVNARGEISVAVSNAVVVAATSTSSNTVINVTNFTVAPTPTNTVAPTATDTPVPTATDTPVPTATNTPVPTATNTPVPTATNTPVPTATNTPVPTATNTPVPTATNTPVPTATNTPVPTATNTPVPTATNTPVPTATNTPVPTATNTPVPTATNTPVPTATNTPVPTATNTPVPTATNTPVPTATNTPAVTPTVTVTTTPVATPTEVEVTSTPTASPTPGNHSDTTTPSPTPSPVDSSTNETPTPTIPEHQDSTGTPTATPVATSPSATPTSTGTAVSTGESVSVSLILSVMFIASAGFVFFVRKKRINKE